MPEPAQVRLARLLHILPTAARDGGARFDELCAQLDVTREELLRDIQEATARAYYLPAGDDVIQIVHDDEIVSVFAGRHFTRPVRLSPRELLALGVGLRLMAAEAEPEEQERRLALAARLEAALAGAPTAGRDDSTVRNPRQAAQEPGRTGGRTLEVEPEQDDEPLDVHLRGDALRGVFADAIRTGRRVRMNYLKPGSESPRERILEPQRLVYTNGRWYVLGRTQDSGDETRVFRLDRVLEATLTEEAFEPVSFDPTQFIDEAGHAFSRTETVTATVRYAPDVARWIQERSGQPPEPDGSIVLEQSVADPDWLARHVLQYGGSAVVLGPPDLREHVARLAARVAGD